MTLRQICSTVAVLSITLAVPSAAPAASNMEVGVADENVLQGLTPGGTDATVAQWRASGVQDVRIFAQWNKLVPQASSGDTKPPEGFRAADPSSYDLSVLDRKLDAVVNHGLNVTLVVTGPGPVWGSSEPARKNGSYKPNPKRFGEFVRAIASHVGARVDRYIIWNEPNQGYWLQPQYSCVGQKAGPPKCQSVAPHLYADLARSGYAAIRAVDKTSRVAIGAVSSRGDQFVRTTNSTTQPLPFLRSMSCLSGTYRRLRDQGCKGYEPLRAEALAYHPHSLQYSPGQADPNPNNARMADLPRLLKVVDRIAAKDRLRAVGASKMPLWLDEYGYQTNPPDKRDGFQSPTLAASYLQWGWSLAARNPRVQSITQYEWFDENTSVEGAQAYNRWQSGLYSADGKPKPLAKVFANPIFGWKTRTAAYVWGQVRPGGMASVTLQRRSAGARFSVYKTLRTNADGIFQLRVPRSKRSEYRFSYVHPDTQAVTTSAATTLRTP